MTQYPRRSGPAPRFDTRPDGVLWFRAMEIIESFKSISDVVIDSYVITDRESRILDYNRAFFALFPRQVARKLKGMTFREVMQVERDVAKECMEMGRHVRLDEISVKMIGGEEELRMILSGVPIKQPDGTTTGAVVILRNVTDEAMIQVKYQEMLETEARERERLTEQIRERTLALVDANDLLLSLQRELVDYKKGLRL
jgi:PAS domain S-box-containing protein